MKKQIFILGLLVISFICIDLYSQSDEAMVEVNGVIKAKGFVNDVYTAGGLQAARIEIPPAPVFKDFPDLTLTVTLKHRTTIMAQYQISDNAPIAKMVTRLMIDGKERTRTVIGYSQSGIHPYWGMSNTWFENLDAGTHKITVQYKSPRNWNNDPKGTDMENRVLQVVVFGTNQ